MTFCGRHLIHCGDGFACRSIHAVSFGRIFLFQVNERMNSQRGIVFGLFLAGLAISVHGEDCENDKKVLESLHEAGFSQEIPAGGETGLTVNVGLDVNSLSTVPHTNKLRMDIQMLQRWEDSALYFSHLNPCHSVINFGKHRESIWTPDELFSNADTIHAHRKSAVIQISANGTVNMAYRVHQDIPCRTHAIDYPFGNTTCTLVWRNDASSRDAYLVKWDQTAKDAFLKDSGFKEVGDLLYLGADFVEEQVFQSSGVYDELHLNLHFHRGHKKIILLFFLPSMLFMLVSWMSLSLGPMAITRSILITMSLVLLMIHYSVNLAGLPETTGITAIDLWKLFSLLFVLGILIELVCVTCMASMGRSRKLSTCCNGHRKGRYDMEPVYEELNDLRMRKTRKTNKCCRYTALFFDFASMWIFGGLFVAFSVLFYLKSTVAVKFLNNINMEDLMVF